MANLVLSQKYIEEKIMEEPLNNKGYLKLKYDSILNSLVKGKNKDCDYWYSVGKTKLLTCNICFKCFNGFYQDRLNHSILHMKEYNLLSLV